MSDVADDSERPPGPDGWPVVGSFPAFARDAFVFKTRLAREYGPLAFYTSLGREFYQVNDPDLVEDVLVHENQKFGKGDLFHTIVDPVGGEGLLTAEGEQWRRQRHMANPAFHPDRIAEYSEIMVEETEALLAEWEDGQTVNVHAEMMTVTLDIVTRALFGMKVDDGGAISDALDVVMERVSSPLSSIVPEWAPTPGNREFFALSTVSILSSTPLSNTTETGKVARTACSRRCCRHRTRQARG